MNKSTQNVPGLRQMVKSGKWTVEQALAWLRKQEKMTGDPVRPEILAWLERRRARKGGGNA